MMIILFTTVGGISFCLGEAAIIRELFVGVLQKNHGMTIGSIKINCNLPAFGFYELKNNVSFAKEL